MSCTSYLLTIEVNYITAPSECEAHLGLSLSGKFLKLGAVI
jgi:hypothetical protein